jgi:hypothetical protein
MEGARRRQGAAWQVPGSQSALPAPHSGCTTNTYSVQADASSMISLGAGGPAGRPPARRECVGLCALNTILGFDRPFPPAPPPHGHSSTRARCGGARIAGVAAACWRTRAAPLGSPAALHQHRFLKVRNRAMAAPFRAAPPRLVRPSFAAVPLPAPLPPDPGPAHPPPPAAASGVKPLACAGSAAGGAEDPARARYKAPAPAQHGKSIAAQSVCSSPGASPPIRAPAPPTSPLPRSSSMIETIIIAGAGWCATYTWVVAQLALRSECGRAAVAKREQGVAHAPAPLCAPRAAATRACCSPGPAPGLDVTDPQILSGQQQRDAARAARGPPGIGRCCVRGACWRPRRGVTREQLPSSEQACRCCAAPLPSTPQAKPRSLPI